jgi:hypothetical protein
MDTPEKQAVAAALTKALLALKRDEAFDQIRVVFLEDEEAIPEISHDFGVSGFDELAFEPLYGRLLRGSDQQLNRLAKRLNVS